MEGVYIDHDSCHKDSAISPTKYTDTAEERVQAPSHKPPGNDFSSVQTLV